MSPIAARCTEHARGRERDEEAAGIAVLGLAVDMGANEFQPDEPAPSCPGDTNGDGFVDVNDLVTLILTWGAWRNDALLFAAGTADQSQRSPRPRPPGAS